MDELVPSLQPRRAVAVPSPALWSRSSAFRKLAVSAGLVTALAIGAPMLLTQPTSCALRQDLLSPPSHGTVKVVSFFDEMSLPKNIEGREAKLGAAIAPPYRSMKWIHFGRPGQPEVSGIAAVPGNLPVKVGDTIELNTFYSRATDLPCGFIPWTVNRILESGDH
jgi:hypothetical protein